MAQPRDILQAPRTAHVPGNVLANFARQLATMLHNGIPLLKGLETLSFQGDYPHFGVVIEQVAQAVSDGDKFSKALAYYPRVFSNVFVTMMEVAEQTGRLGQSLELVADWLERQQRVSRKIRAALTYPLTIFSVAVVLSVVLFTTVLPTFAQIFREMNVSLPLLTQVVMALTSLLCQPWTWVVGVLAGAVGWNWWEGVWKSPRQSRAVYATLLHLPGLGEMLHHGSLSRYCAASRALLHSGIDLLKTSRLAGQASGSPLLAQDSKRVSQAIQDGNGIADSLSQAKGLYSNTLIQLIRAGEEASLVAEMFQRVAQFHELEMESSIELLSATLEPIMLIGVSFVVGSIVLSIYLPMYSTLMNLAS